MTYDNNLIQELELKAKKIRRNILASVGPNVKGHFGGSFSLTEIVAALYFYKMKHNPADRWMRDRDRFLLSKGHVAILQYSALAEAGYFPAEDLKKTKTVGSLLQGHPDWVKNKEIGIEAGTGSLGQGLSLGVGMALANKLDKSTGKVYVAIGDGELAEGQIWEAAMSAKVFKLDNLVAIVDKNDKQANGNTSDRFEIDQLKAKWTSFGFHVIEIDGHDFQQILAAFDEADTIKGQPVAIIAQTVKGKGLPFTEAHPAGFHNAMMTEEEFELANKLLA